MRTGVSNLPLNQVEFMDLVCALQAQLKEPESIKMLEKMHIAQKEAALELGVVAENYVAVVEGGDGLNPSRPFSAKHAASVERVMKAGTKPALAATLEQTIIRAARQELTAIRSSDRDAVEAAFRTVMNFVMLAHMQDSGLSEDAITQLLDIEKEAAQAMAALPELPIVLDQEFLSMKTNKGA